MECNIGYMRPWYIIIYTLALYSLIDLYCQATYLSIVFYSPTPLYNNSPHGMHTVCLLDNCLTYYILM